MNEKMNEKWKLEDYPPHMHVDVSTHNDNIENHRKLCKRCNGTGNELFSMYRKCSMCNGMGYLEKPEGE